MPNEKETPVTSDSNIAMILDKLKEQDSKIASFEKQLDETLAFNRQLLSVSDTSVAKKATDSEARHRALEDKLNKALHGQKEN